MLSSITRSSISRSYRTAIRATATLPSRYHSSVSYRNTNKEQQNHPTHLAGIPSDNDKKGYQIPDFNDSKAAFESKTTTELIRAAVSFRLCKVPFLVNHAEDLLGLSRRLLGNKITDTLLKVTLYGHFCAGEDQKRIKPILEKLDSVGVGSILDYAAESDEGSSGNKKNQVPGTPVNHLKQYTARRLQHTAREYSYEDEDQCDRHVQTFQQCIHDAASLSKDGFAAVKVTALGNPKLLSRMSQAIIETKKLFQKFDSNLDGFVSREEFEIGYK